MSNQPDVPDGLPKYLREGIPKQDTDDLRAVQEWIDELIKYRQDVSPDEIELAKASRLRLLKTQAMAGRL